MNPVARRVAFTGQPKGKRPFGNPCPTRCVHRATRALRPLEPRSTSTMTAKNLDKFRALLGDSKEPDITPVLEFIGDAGGWCELSAVIDEFGDQPPLDALAKPKDARKRPAASLTELTNPTSGEKTLVIGLTSPGWQAIGQHNKRAQKPTLSRLNHWQAPKRIAQWAATATARAQEPLAQQVLNEQMPTMRQKYPEINPAWGGVSSNVLTKPNAIQQLLAPMVKTAAWEAVKHDPHANLYTKLLTDEVRCPRPDLLVYEEWANQADCPLSFWSSPAQIDGETQLRNAANYASSIEEPAVIKYAIEVETSRKSNEAIVDKIRVWDAIMTLGVINAVVWVVDEPTNKRLWNLGVGRGLDIDTSRSVFHCYATVADVNGGDHAATGFLLPEQPRYWLAQYLPQPPASPLA